MDRKTYDIILDTISQGVVILTKDCEIEYCNRAFLDMTGFERAELNRYLCARMRGPESDKETIKAIAAALENGTEFSGEILTYRKSGETFWNYLTLKPEYNDEGSVRHFIGISRDITSRKIAETKARKFERDYKFILDNVQSGVVLHKPNTEIIYANPRALELLGVRDEMAIGADSTSPQWGFIREDESPLPLSEYPVRRAIAERSPVRGMVFGNNRASDGKLVWYVCNAFPVIDDRGDVVEVLTSFSDITQIIEAERQAKAYRERFELAARASRDVIFEWNIETGEYWANEAFALVYGYPPPSHISLETLDEVSAVTADHDFVREVTVEAIRSGKERYSVDYGFIRPDGSQGRAAVRAFIVRDENGNAVRIFGTATDIGQLTQSLAALEESEQRFRQIADTVSDVLWDRDFETGQFWVTPDWTDRLGIAFTPSETGLKRWLEHVDPDDREAIKRSFLEAIRSDAATWEAQYTAVGKDGARIDLNAKAAILRRTNGRVYRMLGNIRNVTAEKRQQEGYSRARALEAVGQLTGGVAHDFNNQLMIVQGNVELLEMSQLDKDQAASVALIGKASQSAIDLTKRLLSFSRQSQLQTERVDLAELLPRIVSLLKAGIPESISITCSVDDSIWKARADANALEQAIVNLALNARDAMPGGGNLVISCSNETFLKGIQPVAFEGESGDYVVVSVSDNGEGMSPVVLQKAFEPFFTTKDVGNGTGLGLSTVYGFASQSGGQVMISSKVHEGTTVRLILPRSEDVESGADTEPTVDLSSTPEGQRILLVEDHPDVRSHVEKILTMLGYSVTAVSNGKEALALMYRALEFDLLFTDVVMPGGLNGQELAEEVRKVDPRIKILYTSGYSAQVFEHLGLDDIDELKLLSKPYSLIELKKALSEIFAK